MTDQRWYYENAGQRVGPFSREDLLDLVQAGLLRTDTGVVDQHENQTQISAVLAAVLRASSPGPDAVGQSHQQERTAAADYPPPPPLPRTVVGPLDKPVVADLVVDPPRCSSPTSKVLASAVWRVLDVAWWLLVFGGCLAFAVWVFRDWLRHGTFDLKSFSTFAKQLRPLAIPLFYLLARLART